jgi:response regulator RpfG family c-di-GMP phosphodiesterase
MSTSSSPVMEESKRPKILFVDDEPFLLEGLRRSLHKEFEADLAGGGAEGLEKIKKSGPYPVVVSDMRMPGMDGAAFLSQVRTVAPESIRVMLTGYADMEAAMRAVNEGRIFRFLNKPVTPDDLALALRACLTQFELARREKELLENTLAGAVRVLTEVLNLANPAAFNKGNRIQQYVSHIAAKLGLADTWQYEIAALLSELGCVTLTPDLVEAIHAQQPLSPEDQQRYRKHPKIGHDLLVRIPRLELVAEMILQQEDSVPALKTIHNTAEQAIHNGAQMVKVSLAFDRLLNSGSSKTEALHALGKSPGDYERTFVSALDDYQVARQPTELRAIDVRDLRTGMVLREDLRAANGILLAAKGQEVSHALVKTVRNFVDNGSVKGTVRVVVGVGETWIAKSAAR